jgi:hypothetical protein
MYYGGSTEPLPFIYAGPRMFVQLRRRLAEGAAGFITIEVAVPDERYVIAHTAAGPRYISPATLAFAERTATPVVFVATYLDATGQPTVYYEHPHGTTAPAMTEEFRDFLQRHAAKVVR